MNYLKAMFWTGVSAFLAVFLPSALGWLNEISATGNIADPSILRSTAVSAVAAAVTAVITAGTVLLREQSWFPGTAPTYLPGPTTNSGQGGGEYPSNVPPPAP